MRRFSFYKRGRVFYVQFYNPKLKKYSSGRSTGETQKNAALLTVGKWLNEGMVWLFPLSGTALVIMMVQAA